MNFIINGVAYNLPSYEVAGDTLTLSSPTTLMGIEDEGDNVILSQEGCSGVYALMERSVVRSSSFHTAFEYRFKKYKLSMGEVIPKDSIFLGTWDYLSIKVLVDGEAVSGFPYTDTFVEYNEEGVSFGVMCTSEFAYKFKGGRRYRIMISHADNIYYCKNLTFSHYEGSLGTEITTIKAVFKNRM